MVSYNEYKKFIENVLSNHQSNSEKMYYEIFIYNYGTYPKSHQNYNKMLSFIQDTYSLKCTVLLESYNLYIEKGYLIDSNDLKMCVESKFYNHLKKVLNDIREELDNKKNNLIIDICG